MIFNYESRTKEGEQIKGVLEASSREAAIGILQKQGLIITKLSLGSLETPFYKTSFTFFEHISKYDLVIFSRQLSFLFEAKIPLIESLKILSEQMSNKKFKKIIEEITHNIDTGMPFSRALADHPQVFSKFYISLVKSGEIAGKLQEVLNYLADHQEREFNLISKVKSAMTYPVFVFFAFLIIISIILVYIIPKITPIFEETGTELPFSTIIIISLSNFLIAYYPYVIIAIILFIIGIFLFIRTQVGRNIFDSLKIKIPVIKTFYHKFYLARIADTLSTMIVGGLPITQALEITSEIISNKRYSAVLKNSEAEVKKGIALNVTLRREKEIFPPLFTQMVSIGEATGNIDSTLKNLSDFYQKEINLAVDGIVALIEPILIVILGVFIAFFVISILMPIYNIAKVI